MQKSSALTLLNLASRRFWRTARPPQPLDAAFFLQSPQHVKGLVVNLPAGHTPLRWILLCMDSYLYSKVFVSKSYPEFSSNFPFSFSVDPYLRTTSWAAISNVALMWVFVLGGTQASFQRYASMKTLARAQTYVILIELHQCQSYKDGKAVQLFHFVCLFLFSFSFPRTVQ